MKNFVIILVWFLGIVTMVSGQKPWGFGFKAGGNWTTIQGPVDEGEKVNYQGGIHLGLEVSWKALPNFGVFSGFGYNQAGAKYDYDGDGYFVFRSIVKDAVVTGHTTTKLLVEHSYLEIPLGIYYKPIKKLELTGGISANILVGSIAKGNMTFTSPSNGGIDFSVLLDYDYLKDNAGEVGGRPTLKRYVPNIYSKLIRGVKYDVPQTLGAYYFLDKQVEKRKYNIFDYGGFVGIKYYLNSALYLSIKGYWGLTDITNTSTDFRYQLDPTNPNALPSSDDVDKNVIYQMSLGFAF